MSYGGRFASLVRSLPPPPVRAGPGGHCGGAACAAAGAPWLARCAAPRSLTRAPRLTDHLLPDVRARTAGFEYNQTDGVGGGFGGDGAAGFGGDQGGNAMGGGFAADNGSQSQGSQGDGKRDRANDTLMPVTVKQLLAATQDQPDDSFMIDGKEATQVSLAGCVVEMSVQSTNVSYQLEDATGRIEVKQWINAEEGEAAASARAQITENMYVRVVGNIRAFKDTRNVIAYSVQAVTDHNAVTTHFLECIFVHLHNTKGQLAGAAGTVGAAAAGQTFGAPAQQGAAAGGGGGGGLGAKQQISAGAGGDDINSIVKECYEGAPDDETGLSVADVHQMVQAKGAHSVDAVRKAVSFLANEGHLYSTVDEEHYKSTV
jgi:replication factor A2